MSELGREGARTRRAGKRRRTQTREAFGLREGEALFCERSVDGLVALGILDIETLAQMRESMSGPDWVRRRASLFATLIYTSYQGTLETHDEDVYVEEYLKQIRELVWLVRLSRQRSAMVELEVTVGGMPAGGFRAEYVAGELFRIGDDLPDMAEVGIVAELEGLLAALHEGDLSDVAIEGEQALGRQFLRRLARRLPTNWALGE